MNRSYLAIVSAEELSNSQPHLHGVNSWIGRGQACVRDVHVTQFKTDIVFRAKDVHAKRGMVSEVHGVGAGGDVVVGEERAAAEVEVGLKSAVTFEVPLEAERVEAHAVRGVGGLEDEEDGDGVDRIFKPSAEKAGQVPAGEDPSVAQSGVEGAGVASSPVDGVAAARPDLDLTAALFWTSLGEAQWRPDQQDREDEKGRAHDD